MALDLLQRFGRRVCALRKKKGISQERLALEADLDRSYIWLIEKGKRDISLRKAERISKVLGVKLHQLLKFPV